MNGTGIHREVELSPQGRLASPYFEQLRQKFPNAFKRPTSGGNGSFIGNSRPSSAIDFLRSKTEDFNNQNLNKQGDKDDIISSSGPEGEASDHRVNGYSSQTEPNIRIKVQGILQRKQGLSQNDRLHYARMKEKLVKEASSNHLSSTKENESEIDAKQNGGEIDINNMSGRASKLKERLKENRLTMKELLNKSPLKSKMLSKEIPSSPPNSMVLIHKQNENATALNADLHVQSQDQSHDQNEQIYVKDLMQTELSIDTSTESSPPEHSASVGKLPESLGKSPDSPSDSAVEMDNGSVQSTVSMTYDNQLLAIPSTSPNGSHASPALKPLQAITKKFMSPLSLSPGEDYRSPPLISRLNLQEKESPHRDSDVDSGIVPASNHNGSLSSNEDDLHLHHMKLAPRQQQSKPKLAVSPAERSLKARTKRQLNKHIGPMKADHNIQPVTTDNKRSKLEQLYWNSKGARPKNDVLINGDVGQGQKQALNQLRVSNKVRFKDIPDDNVDDTDPRQDPLLIAILKLQDGGQDGAKLGQGHMENIGHDRPRVDECSVVEKQRDISRPLSPYQAEDQKQRQLFEMEMSNSSVETNNSSDCSNSSQISAEGVKKDSYCPSENDSVQFSRGSSYRSAASINSSRKGILKMTTKSHALEQREKQLTCSRVNKNGRDPGSQSITSGGSELGINFSDGLLPSPPVQYQDPLRLHLQYDSNDSKKILHRKSQTASIENAINKSYLQKKSASNPNIFTTVDVEINNNEKDIYAVVDRGKGKVKSKVRQRSMSVSNPCIIEGNDSIQDGGLKPAIPDRQYDKSEIERYKELSGSKSSLSGRMDSIRKSAKNKLAAVRRAFSMERIDKVGKESQSSGVKKSSSFKSLRWSFNRKDAASKEKNTARVESNKPPLPSQNSPTRPRSVTSNDVDSPSHARAIGRLLKLNRDGSQIVELVRPPHGPFGFYIAKGNAKYKHGLFISRLSDGHPEKLFAGLISLGDEILEIDNVSVKKMKIDQVYDAMATKQRLVMKILPLLARDDI